MSHESYFSPYNCLQGLLLQIRSKLNFYDPSQSLIRSSFETRSRNSAQCALVNKKDNKCFKIFDFGELKKLLENK